MVKIAKISNNLFCRNYKLMSKVDNSSVGIGAHKPIPIEIQMVPKYLELATHNGKDRFNNEEIEEITKIIKLRKSRGISPTDLIKYLLNIGKENGNILSPREIKDFFEATFTGYNKEAQTRILRFMKALKEGQKPAQKTFLGVLSDNKSYTEGKPNSTSDFVSYPNRLYTKTISQSQRPEILARVAEITGNHEKFYTANSAEALAELYELTGGNAALILDCNRAFPRWRIREIISEIKNPGYTMPEYKLPRTSPDYTMPGYRGNSYNSKQQSQVLEGLELLGKVKAEDFDYKYVDVMDIGRKLSGNFEGGKKRR